MEAEMTVLSLVSNRELCHVALLSSTLFSREEAPLYGKPELLKTALKSVKRLHDYDLADGWGCVLLPNALDRKYPKTPKEWRWQWVFPQEKRWKNTVTAEEGRHHVDASIVQKSVRKAVTSVGLPKRSTCHTFRPFGTPLSVFYGSPALRVGSRGDVLAGYPVCRLSFR
jgi:hypothetical protein